MSEPKQKRKSSTSPTQRTIKALRKDGFECGVVERFNPHGGPHGIRQDLFGFIDVIAVSTEGVIGVQCCAGSGHAAHKTKILANDIAPQWIRAGGRIQIWSWSKKKLKRGAKAMRWQPRMEELTALDLPVKETTDASLAG